MSLTILYAGQTYAGQSWGTCMHRARALEALGHRLDLLECGYPVSGLGYQIYRLGHHLRRPPDLDRANQAIVAAFRHRPYDVLWIDRGRTIRPRTLRKVRALSPRTLIVSYSPDDMMNRSHNSSQYLACVPLYDLHVTTKSYNVPELESLGAPDVLFLDNAFDPQMHRPVELSPEDHRLFDCGVSFIGSHEADRAGQILGLARAGIEVVVRGWGWDSAPERHPNLREKGSSIFGIDYAKAIHASRINLGFLRKANRDLQTTRSIEIPACGGFMLAERTEEHRRLFEEGKEAEFFDSFDELLEKCRYYLAHEDERRRIAAAGLRRCIEGGYSNEGRMRTVVQHIEWKLRERAAG